MTKSNIGTRRKVLAAVPMITAAALPGVALASSELPLDCARRLTDELHAALAELDDDWIVIVVPCHGAPLINSRPRGERIASLGR